MGKSLFFKCATSCAMYASTSSSSKDSNSPTVAATMYRPSTLRMKAAGLPESTRMASGIRVPAFCASLRTVSFSSLVGSMNIIVGKAVARSIRDIRNCVYTATHVEAITPTKLSEMFNPEVDQQHLKTLDKHYAEDT